MQPRKDPDMPARPQHTFFVPIPTLSLIFVAGAAPPPAALAACAVPALGAAVPPVEAGPKPPRFVCSSSPFSACGRVEQGNAQIAEWREHIRVRGALACSAAQP